MTKLIDEPSDTPRSNTAKGTTIMGGSPTGTRIADPAVAPKAPSRGGAVRSVVGWLAVIVGPGKGASVEIGYGMNTVGRGPENRIPLPFGDDQISSEDHFRIAYDGENRQFHLVPGRGTNLVYLAGKPLLAPEMLNTMSDFRVGATTLRFVALCGPDWDWGEDTSLSR